MRSPAQVVEEYLAALDGQDFDRVRLCLSDEFSHRGPVFRFDDPDEFVASVWHFGQILHRIEMRKMFVEGSDVCCILTLHIHLHERRSVPAALLARVEEGKIRSLEIIYDSAEYKRLFEV